MLGRIRLLFIAQQYLLLLISYGRVAYYLLWLLVLQLLWCWSLLLWYRLFCFLFLFLVLMSVQVLLFLFFLTFSIDISFLNLFSSYSNIIISCLSGIVSIFYATTNRGWRDRWLARWVVTAWLVRDTLTTSIFYAFYENIQVIELFFVVQLFEGIEFLIISLPICVYFDTGWCSQLTFESPFAIHETHVT